MKNLLKIKNQFKILTLILFINNFMYSQECVPDDNTVCLSFGNVNSDIGQLEINYSIHNNI